MSFSIYSKFIRVLNQGMEGLGQEVSFQLLELLKKNVFPLSIKNITNNKTQELFIYVKNKYKSNLQTKTEPLTNLHLAAPRQHFKLKRTCFRASF